MLISNYTARSGLIAQQQRLDIIANNIANVNTIGYKNVRADFKDMVYQTQVRVEQPQDDLNLRKGHGVLLGASTRDISQGAQQYSGYPLDFSLYGDGFFTVQSPTGGAPLYTRDGSFSISHEPNGNFLTNQNGFYVLDSTGQRINLLDATPDAIEVNTDGFIYINRVIPATDTEPAHEEKVLVGQFGLAHFTNRAGLAAQSGNLFSPTSNSGEAQPEQGSKVIQGTVEMSNVELANEMVRMIRAQRSFSLAGKVLTTADDMDAKAIQIKG